MRRCSLTTLAIAVTFVISLVVAGGAQAVVVDMNAVGNSTVAYNSSNQSGYYGVAMMPSSNLPSTIPTVTSSGSCIDPALPADLILPDTGLCSHGGSVMHANETFAFTWDPDRRYWASTRNYVERFLSDVASNGGQLNAPYAVTTQYTDSTGRAGNSSLYGGGCIDFGDVGGASCKLGATNGSGAGHGYPANGCSVSGNNQFHEETPGFFDTVPNDICLTDAQLRSEITTMVNQTSLLGNAKPGHTPLIVLLTPPGVETCLASNATLCSANGGTAAQFCSYHSQVDVQGTEVPYIVQPWTAETTCDDPSLPSIPSNPTPAELATAVGSRLVSPLSQSQIAAIVNPHLNDWFALDGAEINDNGCEPLGDGLDTVPVGGTSYDLQREFNNAGVIESDPNALACEGQVLLAPAFVVPSAVNAGDEVVLDGSTTVSSLIVPKTNYRWNLGDGTTAIGSSVEHAYTKGGTYTVTLTATDRGGNFETLAQTIQVLGESGQPVTGGGGSGPSSALHVQLQLMPQGLKAVLRSGIAVRVSSNLAANGIASVSISRSAAKHAHIKAGHGPAIVIGKGTLTGVKAGTVNLRLRLRKDVAKKLRHLKHVTLTVRLALVASGGGQVAVDAAGRY
jgi:hypothetical protein